MWATPVPSRVVASAGRVDVRSVLKSLSLVVPSRCLVRWWPQVTGTALTEM